MNQRTVLLADDEPHVRYMLEFKFRTAGFQVITSNNGVQAYELTCEHRPDLVITDYQMPGGDGLELCTRLRENPETSEIPAIMLTARGYRISDDDIQKTNIKHLIAKPFSPRHLLLTAGELLGMPIQARPGPENTSSNAA